MDDDIETLLIDVRASTEGFRSDVEAMRGSIDGSLVDGFARAGNVLERGLLTALRRGSLGFEDLKRTALQALDQIAAQAISTGVGNLFGGSGHTSGLGGLLAGTIGTLLGLPGRATGGPVSPGSAYVVGERGPEVFVPTSAGRVETAASGPRDVRVSITMPAPRSADVPAMLQRSNRQLASTVRRALQDF